jgi:hypothetical protein
MRAIVVSGLFLILAGCGGELDELALDEELEEVRARFGASDDASLASLPPSQGPVLRAADDAELTLRLKQSAPGQHILLTGPRYTAPRTLGPGDVVVNRELARMPLVLGRYTLAGAGAIVYGLDFRGVGVSISGDRARLLRSRIHDLGKESPVGVSGGDQVVIAYNEIFRWGTTAACGAARGLTIRAPRPNGSDGATRIKVFRNYFHDQIGRTLETCEGDSEVIAAGQTGASGRGESRFEGHFHHNLIVSCLGDNEGFGVKSSYNLIERNHLVNLRGFNLRLGGFNTFIANRLEGTSKPGGDRGGYRNLSLGEVFAGRLSIRGGDGVWGSNGDYRYLRSDGTRVIGARAASLEVGVDRHDIWSLPALGTLIEATSVAPTLGPEQKGTLNRWSQAASLAVPDAVRLTPAEVGPLSTR